MGDNKPTLTDPTRQLAKVEPRHLELAAIAAGTNEHLLLYLERIAQALADIEAEGYERGKASCRGRTLEREPLILPDDPEPPESP